MKDFRFYILFFSIFVSVLGLTIITPLIPTYMREMGESGFAIGMIFAGFAISRVIFTPIIGEISDRKGRKNFISAGLLLYSATSLLYILPVDLYSLTAIRFAQGFASVLIASAAMAYAGDISEEGKEGRVMAMINVAIFTGVGTGPILGGILSHNFGGVSIFYVLSALAALAFLITLFSLPETEKPILKESGFTHLRNLIKRDILKVLVVWGVSAPMGIALVISFIPILAARSGLLPTQVGIIISACVFLIALLQEPFGRLADKVTPYKKIFLLFTGQLIVSVALLFTPACRSMAALFIVTGVVGLGTAIAYPVGSEIAVLVGRRAGMGSCIGLVTASKGAGTAITPLVAGLVMDTFGLNAVFYIVAILILVCKLICYYYTSRWLETNR